MPIDVIKNTIRLILAPALTVMTAHAGLPPITEQEAGSGNYTYAAGWDSLIPESAGTRSKAQGTFFGDAEQVSGFSVGNDTANGVRTVNVRPGINSAVIEYKFDFSKTSARVVRLNVRDVLRLEPEPGNWAIMTTCWQADDKGPWVEIRSLSGTRFSAPPARINEVTLPAPAAVIRYRVEFASEKPVAHKWGRARWNYLKKDNAADNAFRIDFTLEKAGKAGGGGGGGKGPVARTATPNDKSPWGVSAHPLRNTEWDHLDSLVQRVGEAGIMWLREDFSFPRILTKGGEFDFSKFDVLVDRLDRAGVGAVGILTAYDSDLRKKGFGDIVPIYQHPEAWRRYVRSMVGRYHDRVRHWVIWNEPDGGFWFPKSDAAQYTQLLKIAYEEIKRIDPASKVITGGLEYWNTEYLRGMYLAGASGHYDIVGVHRYGPGPNASPVVRRTMREFRALMAENNDARTPIWMLECGGSTFQSPLLSQQPFFMEKAVRYALGRIGRAPVDGVPVVAGLALSPRIDPDKHDEIATTRHWLPGVQFRLIPFDQLASLSPDECPVVVMENGLHIDRPMLEPLRDWVARGGLLVAIGHPPFFVMHTQNESGIWQRRDAVGETYPVFRMGFAASWNKKGIPAQTENVYVPESAIGAGLPSVSKIYVNNFFTPDRLQPGDTFAPLLGIRNAKGEPVPDVAAIALYTYHDWKGAILASTPSLGGGWTEEEQAGLIPRIYLSYLGTPESGVERLFVYDLHDDGQKRGEREHNFGLTRWDWSPKPSHRAYAGMTKALGVAPHFVRRIETKTTSVWAIVFQRAEDGRYVLAAWTADVALPFALVSPAVPGGEMLISGTSVQYHVFPEGAEVDALSIRQPPFIRSISTGGGR